MENMAEKLKEKIMVKSLKKLVDLRLENIISLSSEKDGGKGIIKNFKDHIGDNYT
jgi:hypothetical protein